MVEILHVFFTMNTYKIVLITFFDKLTNLTMRPISIRVKFIDTIIKYEGVYFKHMTFSKLKR